MKWWHGLLAGTLLGFGGCLGCDGCPGPGQAVSEFNMRFVMGGTIFWAAAGTVIGVLGQNIKAIIYWLDNN